MRQLSPVLIVLAMVVAACGSDDTASVDSTALGATAATQAEPSSSAGDTEAPAPTASGGGGGAGTATLTLENGQSFEFGILCMLQSQDVGSTEILFNVVSYDDPLNLDVTQFGAGSFGGVGVVGLYDSTSFDTAWEADGTLGAQIELTLDGTTVRGTGVFHEGGDPATEGVPGSLIANCG